MANKLIVKPELSLFFNIPNLIFFKYGLFFPVVALSIADIKFFFGIPNFKAVVIASKYVFKVEALIKLFKALIE